MLQMVEKDIIRGTVLGSIDELSCKIESLILEDRKPSKSIVKHNLNDILELVRQQSHSHKSNQD